MNANEYECAMCHGVFEKTRPDGEALEEMLKDFGPVPVEDQLTVCDDCYQLCKPEANPEIYAEFLKEQSERNKQT